MLRQVIPELLDELPPDDPRAVHSRGDLKRVNRLMGNADIMARALLDLCRPGPSGPGVVSIGEAGPKGPALLSAPFSLVELGAGDGTFLLQVAKRMVSTPKPVRAVLVDQQLLLTQETRARFEALSWHVDAVQADVFEWLQSRVSATADVTLANLFLHHFTGDSLATLLKGASHQTRTFVACEPYRSRVALAAASLVGAIGCNDVTVHDAKISVRAGFRGYELSAAWPQDGEWRLTEWKAGRFTQGFLAKASRDH